ncbi:sensor histidine kinase [Actinokineospora spheciospongiae]|uniref:sensor histidine kinase n=1 Tax=Actinokineospora spheciospongiae TaxID=909613 RepID=UPI000D71B8BF|nr:sensor histidine kinase [Actinokineospora spheciospongiae]PWW63020.1 phospho-acceptor domain-containing protein [Actinokineospora spheciospongiae]
MGAERATRWSLRRWVAVAVLVLVVVFAGGSTAGARAIADLDRAREDLVDRVDPALREALRLDTALVDQETGVRGYALTAHPGSLEPFTSGVGRAEAAVSVLRGLVAGLPEARAALDRVVAEAGRWRVAHADPAVARLGSGGSVDAAAVAGGKAAFDRVRAAVDGLQWTLGAAREAGRAALSDAASSLVAVCVLVAVVLLAAFVAVTAGVRVVVAGPVARLAAGVRRVVADDDFARPLPVGGPREVTGLSDDVDSMRRRIVAEVAAQRAVNAELDLRTGELRRSNSELEQFAYVASHDLREPLRKGAGFCQLLERRYRGQFDERADQYLGFAADGARRMQGQVNDLLAFSRVGSQDREPAPVDLGAVAALAVADLGPAIEESGAVVEVGPLPTVLGEGPLLTGVFRNLIGNAIKFRGEDPPHVRVEARDEGEEYAVAVTDNGIGIRPEFAERVFVIFQRLHTKDAYPGTGIGLAMCRKIVEHHGGRIGVEQVERGTRLRFTLPKPDPARLAAAHHTGDAPGKAENP